VVIRCVLCLLSTFDNNAGISPLLKAYGFHASVSVLDPLESYMVASFLLVAIAMLLSTIPTRHSWLTSLIGLLGTSLRQVKRHAQASESANHELAGEIEERLKTDAELREARGHLELRVQQRTAELTALNNQLPLEVATRQQTEEA
jgi:C4-dicarboxylate-specific signal transduction histidine kinase